MLKLFGTNEQLATVESLTSMLASKGITVTSYITGHNEEAGKALTDNGFTMQPVLFHQSESGEITKIAEGDGIASMSDAQIDSIKATISADVAGTPPSADAINKQPIATTKKL